MIVNLIVGFFVGLCSGASVVISQFYGAKDHKNLKKALHTSMIFCLAASIIVGTAGFILAEPILHLMKTPAEVIPDSVLYLHIYFAGTFFNLVYNMVSSILRAVGDSKRPLYVLIITCLLNILLDVVFVVIFHMGVLGVALATVSCQAVSAILVTWFLMRAEDIYRLEFHEIRFDLRSLGAVLRIGLPAGLESVMYNIANLTIQIFVNELGTDTVAAWGTMGKIDAVFWMVCNAFAISITTFVGQNYGAGKYHRMRKSVRVCMVMAYISAFIVSGALILFANPIYHLFTTDQVVVDIGVHMIRFLIPSCRIAKKRPCLYDNGLHYRLYCPAEVFFCLQSLFTVCLPHRSGSCGHRCSYDPFPDPVLCPLCSDRYSLRCTQGSRKSADTHDPDLREEVCQ